MESIKALIDLKNEVDTSYDEDYEKWINIRYNAILKDLERLEQVENENKKLKNQILSLELDTCIPELRKENIKLKDAIEILKKYGGINVFVNQLTNKLMLEFDEAISIVLEPKDYELLKEVLGSSKTTKNT